jgi:quinoprotein glucose dehydrogenase
MNTTHSRRLLTLSAAALLALGGVYAAAKTKTDGKNAKPAPTTAPATPLVLTTWAPPGFLKNPTALSFDRQGRCYVAQTQRREGGEMTARADLAHNMVPDHTFTTVEDRARFGGNGDAAWGDETGGKMETITLLEDSHGSGKADKATVFYEGFNRNISDIMAGVMWYEGNVYATVAPDLWMLRDTNGTGHADEIHSISHGYAVHMGYPGHNMHGLTVGPDGKLYCTMGDKGINLTGGPPGRDLDYHNTGTVVRMNPDGSDPEVFCYGVRNTFEVAFDKYGNLFAVDNDADFPTERERFVYLTQDSDSGWRFHYQYRSAEIGEGKSAKDGKFHYNVWMAEKMWVPYFKEQASYILPPLSNYSDGPAGFKYATEGSLDPRYAGYFFLTQFPKALITAFRAEPKGAAFVMADEQTIVRGTQCVGLALGPDGAIYGAGWGKSGFKLGQTGSVVKLDDPAAAGSPLRKETEKLLREGPQQKSDEELKAQLGNVDMRVREDAQFELARRKSSKEFLAVAFDKAAGQLVRIHALWGLGQLINGHVLEKPAATDLAAKLLSGSFEDTDPEIRVQAVKLLGEIVIQHGPVVDDAGVLKMLGDESLRVRYFAAVTLGKFADPKAVPALLQLAADNHPLDPYIRLAAVLGMVGCNDPAQLVAAEGNPSVQARLAAIVSLRRMKNAGVARFLGDKDELVVTEAARAIHDDESIPEALPALARLIDRPNLSNEALLRRVLNANLRLGGSEQIAGLARYAADEGNPAKLRIEALDMLTKWEEPLVNDRVEGIYRIWPKRNADEVRSVITPLIPAILAATDPNVSRAATVLVDKLQLRTDDTVFAQWVGDAKRPAASRAAALHLLASRKFAKLNEMIDTALASKEPGLRVEALHVLAENDPKRAATEIAGVLAGDSIPEKQAAYQLLPDLKLPQAESMLVESMDKLLAGKLPAEVQLDVLDAAERVKSATLAEKLAKYQGSLSKTDPLAPFQACLAGGDAERGREVFTGHAEFACITCHSIDGTGSTVGPSLAGIGSKPDKPRRYLLESMILPNAYIVPGYGVAGFTLKDGRTLSGFVRSEDATSIHLLDLESHATTIAKADVTSHTDPTSMMPAMGTNLTHGEIRDVIAYLESLK